MSEYSMNTVGILVHWLHTWKIRRIHEDEAQPLLHLAKTWRLGPLVMDHRAFKAAMVKDLASRLRGAEAPPRISPQAVALIFTYSWKGEDVRRELCRYWLMRNMPTADEFECRGMEVVNEFSESVRVPR